MKILGIGTISPLWKDVFNNINIEKKNLSIFSESFINKSNNFAYKTYSYPNIIYQETYKKINKKKFIFIYIYCNKNFTIYNNNLSRFFNNFDKYNSTNRYIFIDKLIKKLIHIFQTENFNLVICGILPIGFMIKLLRIFVIIIMLTLYIQTFNILRNLVVS